MMSLAFRWLAGWQAGRVLAGPNFASVSAPAGLRTWHDLSYSLSSLEGGYIGLMYARVVQHIPIYCIPHYNIVVSILFSIIPI